MQLDRNDHNQHLRIMYTHLVWKGLQAGSLLTPIILLIRHRSALTIPKLLSGTWKGALIGCGVSIMLGYARLYDQNHEQIFNRAYRLTHNVSQNRVDQYSLIGAGIGALAASLLIRKPVGVAQKVLGGAAFGILGGMLVHVMQGDITEKVPHAMINEVVDAKDAITELVKKKAE